ncbi:MAG: cytochrome c-type biogenesis protein CcmH [Paracoccaceae bacterium]|nr:cytochrome c-type biogenesis protein CcmH [Paracoccaceae bacterium]
MARIVMFMAAVMLAFAVPSPVQAIDPDEMFTDLAQEERAREIGKQLRCLVCQNQSIFDSNAGLARDLRMVVRERITAGDNDDQIITFVAERFGDYVLLEPPIKQTTYALWAAPVVFLIAALGLGAVYLRRRQPVIEDGLSEAERAEAQRLLKGGDA